MVNDGNSENMMIKICEKKKKFSLLCKFVYRKENLFLKEKFGYIYSRRRLVG